MQLERKGGWGGGCIWAAMGDEMHSREFPEAAGRTEPQREGAPWGKSMRLDVLKEAHSLQHSLNIHTEWRRHWFPRDTEEISPFPWQPAEKFHTLCNLPFAPSVASVLKAHPRHIFLLAILLISQRANPFIYIRPWPGKMWETALTCGSSKWHQELILPFPHSTGECYPLLPAIQENLNDQESRSLKGQNSWGTERLEHILWLIVTNKLTLLRRLSKKKNPVI